MRFLFDSTKEKSMMLSMMARSALALTACLLITGCSSQLTNRVLNPFYESPSPIAQLGEKNDHALNDGGNKNDTARQALDAMASYRRAQLPQPNYPVVQPAVVRLMWIPDHLNKNGDLVPAHYYYLKVLEDRWAVQDAFDLEAQLNSTTSGDASNVPYVLENDKK